MRTEKTTANDVADYILLSAHASGSFTSNLKLQKLLYYVQGWHLAVFDHPLFDEKFQAWVHGPVIPTVYQRFRSYQWRNIDERIEQPPLSLGTMTFIEEVLDEYGALDARRLESLTHSEAPWREARAGLSQDEPCVAEISNETMRTFYRERLTDEEVEKIRQEPERQTALGCPEESMFDEVDG